MRPVLAAVALAAIAVAASLPAAAQQAPPPPKLEPIPEAPPQPIGVDQQLASEVGVTLRPGDRAERFIVDGQEYIRVTTQAGTEYYLVEAIPGLGPFAGANPQDSGVRVPLWRVFEW
jgi:hypothetical protein